MRGELQSIVFVLVFFTTWGVTTVVGGLIGFLFGWIPAFVLATLFGYAAEYVIVFALLTGIGIYIINHG